LIHIIPQDQNLIKEIENGLKFPAEFLSLGRREDLAIIKDIKMVDIAEKELPEDIQLPHDYAAYIPIRALESGDINLGGQNNGIVNRGTIFNLAKDYTKTNVGTAKNPKIFRKWNKVKVVYSTMITALEEGVVLTDDDNNIVFAV